MMAEREICGVCRNPWPCTCTDAAQPVVIMESVDDDLVAQLAHRMGAGRDDPLALAPYDPDPLIKVKGKFYGEGYCGHRNEHFDVDADKRIVSCRKCGTALDPYDVLERLAWMWKQVDYRLAACQELERRETERKRERKAQAAVRRHRYADIGYRDRSHRCAACGGGKDDAIHTPAVPKKEA